MFLSLCLLLCFKTPLPPHSSDPPRPPFYNLSNFCKSVLAVTFTIEMVRIEALKKKNRYYGEAQRKEEEQLKSLQLIQNGTVSVLAEIRKRAHIYPIITSLTWFPVKSKIEFNPQSSPLIGWCQLGQALWNPQFNKWFRNIVSRLDVLMSNINNNIIINLNLSDHLCFVRFCLFFLCAVSTFGFNL